ncbi:hypothetical protein Ancab_022198 [Ancistrocladus abbreviatus]
MASPKFPESILAISLLFILSQPAYPKTCTTQTFTDKTFENCVDLPYLNAYFHWTYNQSESSLSMGYIAPPAQAGGWISWGINPNGNLMPGSQALVAFKQSNGSMTVKKFQLISYVDIQEGPLQFNVSDVSAESSRANMMFFAKWALPKNTTVVNHVWQAGPGVANGKPEIHAITGDNLNSYGKLNLTQSAAAPGGAPPPGSGGNSDCGKSLMKGVGITAGLLVVGALAFSF